MTTTLVQLQYIATMTTIQLQHPTKTLIKIVTKNNKLLKVAVAVNSTI